MRGNWEAAIRAAVEKKMRRSVDEGCEEAVAILKGWVVNWNRQPTITYSITQVSALEVEAAVTVEDIPIVGDKTRWELNDEGTDPVSIDIKALGKNYRMRFPFKQPYPAVSIAADGSGGGVGRSGPEKAVYKISNRSIAARGWSKKIKEKYPYIKMKMKQGFNDG